MNVWLFRAIGALTFILHHVSVHLMNPGQVFPLLLAPLWPRPALGLCLALSLLTAPLAICHFYWDEVDESAELCVFSSHIFYLYRDILLSTFILFHWQVSTVVHSGDSFSNWDTLTTKSAAANKNFTLFDFVTWGFEVTFKHAIKQQGSCYAEYLTSVALGTADR